jgi:hypothetical protein
MEKELKVSYTAIKAIYDTASEEFKVTLEKIFGKEAFAFDYRTIKSFEDACDKLGISKRTPVVPTANEYCKEALEQSEAMYKLLVICKAINDGQQYDEEGYTWAPIYYFYTKDELKEMGEEKRKARHIQLLSAANAGLAELSGVRCAYANHRGAFTYAYYGFPLCANSEEKALYLDEQFRDLIYTCYGIKVKEE